MFRKMRRFKQQLSDEECIAGLRSETRGVLSMLGDDGYPYGIPMNHWYCEGNRSGYQAVSEVRLRRTCRIYVMVKER